MKICLVHRHFPPEGRGGICTYISTLARGLADRGHTVHVIARAETGSDRTTKEAGIMVHRLAPLSSNPMLNTLTTGIGHVIRKATGKFANRLWASRRIAEKVEQLAAEGEIDLIETAEWEAELFWYLKHSRDRVPTVVKLHAPMEIIREVNRMKKDPAFDCLARWEREMTLKAEHVSSPSRHLAEEMARRWGLDPEKIEVIPYPIDPNQFSPPEGARKIDPPTVLYVGRLEKNKGADVLFSAIPSVLERRPSVKFRIIGSDTQTGEGGGSFQKQLLRDLPGRCHSQVEMVGPKSHGELAEEYQRATVFVIPSLFDNFPNTCLEAMACGCAAVGSDTGGIREMLEGGKFGRLFPTGDSDGLAKSLIGLLNEPSRLEHYGELARKRVEDEYSLEKIMDRTVDYYKRIVGAETA